VAGAAAGQGGQPGGVLGGTQRDGRVQAHEGRGRTSEQPLVDLGEDLVDPRHGAGAGCQRPPPEQRPGVDQAAAAHVRGRPELGVVAAPDRVEVAGRQLVQGCVPGEVGQAVGARTVAGDPVIHPGQSRDVVAGLVVRVRPGVGRVTGGGLGGERRAGEVHRLVEQPLLLAHEREQAGVPPVVAVRRSALLHDPPRLLRHRGHPGEGDRGHRHRQQQRVGGVALEVPDQGSGVAGEVPVDRVHVAALPLGASSGVQTGVAKPGGDVDRRAELVAEQRQRRVAERERRVERDRRGDRLDGPPFEPEQVPDAPVVRRNRVCARGERESVAVDVQHVSTVGN
jgi:hypothetical protein